MSLSSRLLPITRRGLFSEDDFFQDFQQDYSTAVHDVLDRWGGRSMLADQFSNYRKARQAEPDSSLAASISETPEEYVIVLDMTDYVSGEISVRTRGLNAVVDAKAGSAKTFNRSYPLPKDANTEAVVAAMSDEGILTITAKRKGTAAKLVGVTTSVDATATEPNLQNFVSSLKIDVGQNDGSPPLSPSATSQASTSETASQSSSSGDIFKTLPISRRGQFFKDAYFENVWKDFDGAMDEMVSKQKQRQEKKQEERLKREQARKEVLQKMQAEQEEQRRRQQAERMERQRKASEEMTSLFQMPSMTDRLGSYRTLRTWAGGEDNQASTITSDSKAYKVVLDVKDFADGELDLKSDGEVLTVSGGKGGVSFKREFSLPGLASPEQVTASLSEDGVLTITAPKK